MSDKNKHEKNHYLGLGIGFGLIAGSAIGILVESLIGGIGSGMFFAIPIGSSIGMLMGIVVGTLLDSKIQNK